MNAATIALFGMQPPVSRYPDRGTTGVDAELGQDMGDMRVDRALAEEEVGGDLLIGLALCEQVQHVQLPRGEIGVPVLGCRLRDSEAHRHLECLVTGEPATRFKGSREGIVTEGEARGDSVELPGRKRHGGFGKPKSRPG